MAGHNFVRLRIVFRAFILYVTIIELSSNQVSLSFMLSRKLWYSKYLIQFNLWSLVHQFEELILLIPNQLKSPSNTNLSFNFALNSVHIQSIKKKMP